MRLGFIMVSSRLNDKLMLCFFLVCKHDFFPNADSLPWKPKI
jgi:hypothetical protein